MVAQIKMPALSPTMTEGKLSKWLIQKSSKVVSGDIIAEIETDKATMEIEAVDDGVLYEIFVEEGTDNVAVGSTLALIKEAIKRKFSVYIYSVDNLYLENNELKAIANKVLSINQFKFRVTTEAIWNKTHVHQWLCPNSTAYPTISHDTT